MQRPIVLVCGDLHNMGDLALLLQNVEAARAHLGELRVRRWQSLPAAVEVQITEAGAKTFDGRLWQATLAAAWGADVIVGGGQLIRNNVSRWSLLSLLGLLAVSRLTGGRVMTRGLGVSKIDATLPRLLWRAIFLMTNYVRVRDKASAANARSMAAARKVMLTADMAFLSTNLQDRMRRLRVQGGEQLVIAPCIDASEGRSIEGPAIRAIVNAAHRRLGSHPSFACHDPRPEMDALAAERLMSKLSITDTAVQKDYHLDDLFRFYASARLVITNRLHAAIFSLLDDRAVLIIDDGTHKIAALAHQFGIPSVPAGSELTQERADELIVGAISFDRRLRASVVAELAIAASNNID